MSLIETIQALRDMGAIEIRFGGAGAVVGVTFSDPTPVSAAVPPPSSFERIRPPGREEVVLSKEDHEALVEDARRYRALSAD